MTNQWEQVKIHFNLQGSMGHLEKYQNHNFKISARQPMKTGLERIRTSASHTFMKIIRTLAQLQLLMLMELLILVLQMTNTSTTALL
jgi:hypothetical protein